MIKRISSLIVFLCVISFLFLSPEQVLAGCSYDLATEGGNCSGGSSYSCTVSGSTAHAVTGCAPDYVKSEYWYCDSGCEAKHICGQCCAGDTSCVAPGGSGSITFWDCAAATGATSCSTGIDWSTNRDSNPNYTSRKVNITNGSTNILLADGLYSHNSTPWTDTGNLTLQCGSYYWAHLKYMPVDSTSWWDDAYDSAIPNCNIQAVCTGNQGAISWNVPANTQGWYAVQIWDTTTNTCFSSSDWSVNAVCNHFIRAGVGQNVSAPFSSTVPGHSYRWILSQDHGNANLWKSLKVGNFSCPLSCTLANGVCGSANGGSFTSAPATNLCSSGTVSAVSGSGPWSWTCTGSCGGSTANCSANIVTHSECQNGTCTPGIAGASQAGDCTTNSQCISKACSGAACQSTNWTGRGTATQSCQVPADCCVPTASWSLWSDTGSCGQFVSCKQRESSTCNAGCGGLCDGWATNGTVQTQDIKSCATAPGTFTLVSPTPSGMTTALVPTSLRWTLSDWGCNPTAQNYKVSYCPGASCTPTLASTITVNSFTAPTTYNTTYNWNVQADNGIYTSTSPLWSFTTVYSPFFTTTGGNVTSNGGAISDIYLPATEYISKKSP